MLPHQPPSPILDRRKEPRPRKPMRNNALDIDIRMRTQGPQLDEDILASPEARMSAGMNDNA